MKTEVIHTPVFTYNLLVSPGNLRQEILPPPSLLYTLRCCTYCH